MSEWLTEGPRLIDLVIEKVTELLDQEGKEFGGVEDFYDDEDGIQIWVYVADGNGGYDTRQFDFERSEFQEAFDPMDYFVEAANFDEEDDIPF